VSSPAVYAVVLALGHGSLPYASLRVYQRVRTSGESGLSLLRYPLAMVPPFWPDEHGRPLPTYPCSRCGREVAVRFKGFRVEHLKHVGWGLFRAETYVNWCGHGQGSFPCRYGMGG
jgi:hypothetical protein